MRDEFGGFYAVNYGDTVAMVYTYTADLGDAQDIAQEAFTRAWRRWTQVSRYDNPVAWVRHVAVNLARSRWRQLRVSAAHLVRQRAPHDVPAVSPDHVAVVAALRKLPRKQREAVVLHHMMDLPVSEVAEHFGVPEGTVKSWLHRGRTTLADDLRVDVRKAIVTPPVENVQKPSSVRRKAVALAITLVLVGVGYLVTRAVRGTALPIVPAVTPSPSKSSDPMATVDWKQATIKFDLDAEDCARGEMRFEDLPARPVARLGGEAAMVQTTLYPPAIGDLDGDGRAEAVLGVYCMPNPGWPLAERLMVVSRSADGVLYAVAITPHRLGLNRSLRIESNTIIAGEGKTLERWRLTPRGSLEQLSVG